jgi:DNA polymerase-3 subunit delta
MRIKGICNAYKVGIDSNTMMYFIETCGTNMQSLINEIRKLIEYAGENGTITKENIDSLSIKELEARIFDLTDSLGKKDTKGSIELLNELLYNKEPIQKILITLYNHFKRLYIVKLCEKYKEDITKTLNLKPNQVFLISKYKRQASYFKEEELRKILSELIELDNKTKVGKIDINVGLESILCVYF